jgi:hypothetical protein
MAKLKKKRFMVPSWNKTKKKHKDLQEARTEHRKQVNSFYEELKRRVEHSVPKAKVTNKRFNAENGGSALYFDIKKKKVKLTVKFEKEIFYFITYVKKVKLVKVCLAMKDVIRHAKKELA